MSTVSDLLFVRQQHSLAVGLFAKMAGLVPGLLLKLQLCTAVKAPAHQPHFQIVLVVRVRGVHKMTLWLPVAILKAISRHSVTAQRLMVRHAKV
jgi:hypothetical protein